MKKAEKAAAIAELTALVNNAPKRGDLAEIARWTYKIKDAFHRYMPHNNLPEVVGGSIYEIAPDGTVPLIRLRRDHRSGIQLAKSLLKSVVYDLSQSLDIVD